MWPILNILVVFSVYSNMTQKKMLICLCIEELRQGAEHMEEEQNPLPFPVGV